LVPLTTNVNRRRQRAHCRAGESAWELNHAARMPIATLQLTVSGSNFSLTPLPAQVQSRCTGDASCRERATHRLLVRSPASATLFCDDHVLEWTGQNGYHVTTGIRSDDSAA
jgi:hypothetical protein